MTSVWHPFFTTEVAAAAGLTGLIFVAISINLARIIPFPALVSRAGEALVLLVQPVSYGLTLLTPYGHTATGVVTTIFSVSFGAVLIALLIRTRPPGGHPEYTRGFIARVIVVGLAMTSELVGSLLLLSGSWSGIGWIGFGALACVAIGISDTWVLLVEILR